MTIDRERLRRRAHSKLISNAFHRRVGLGPTSTSIRCRSLLTASRTTLAAIAEKRGMVAFRCESADGKSPTRATRRQIENQVSTSAHEHLIIYLRRTPQVAGRGNGFGASQGNQQRCASTTYRAGQTGEALAQRLEAIAFSLDEEEGLTIVTVAGRARQAFDVDRVTKQFLRPLQERARRLPQVRRRHSEPRRPRVVRVADAQPPDVRLLHSEEGISRSATPTISGTDCSCCETGKARTSSTPSIATSCCGCFTRDSASTAAALSSTNCSERFPI